MNDPRQDWLPIHIRWLIRRDLEEVLKIERASFIQPWNQDLFLALLRHREFTGLVAEAQERIVGFIFYEPRKETSQLLNLAVDPACRRRGVAAQLVERVCSRLSLKPHHKVVACVRETNLDAQLFFQALGFRAVRVLRDFFENTDEDAYVMRRRADATNDVSKRVARFQDESDQTEESA